MTCLPGWRRVLCVVDNVNHRLPRWLRVGWLCDLHGVWLLDALGRDFYEADEPAAVVAAQFDAGEKGRTGPPGA